jgi:hypothetical protein
VRKLSVANCARPTGSPAYASPTVLPSPSQGWLPTRAGSPFAGWISHPLDSRRSFMELSRLPILLDQKSLVAPCGLSALDAVVWRPSRLQLILFGAGQLMSEQYGRDYSKGSRRKIRTAGRIDKTSALRSQACARQAKHLRRSHERLPLGVVHLGLEYLYGSGRADDAR